MTDPIVSISGGSDETSLSLLDRARCNEDDAWSRLVDLYGGVIYIRCRSRWGLPASEAQSIGQDVFATIAKRLKDFDRQRPGSFRAWVRTITDNKCKDLLKKVKREDAAGGSAAWEMMKSIPDPSVAWGGDDSDKEREYQASECVLIMRQAVASMRTEFTERDWNIFWKVVVESRVGNQVATDFDVSPNVVYLVCSRIKKRLGQLYEDILDDDILGDDHGEKETSPVSGDPV